jgi:hypothetical protein
MYERLLDKDKEPSEEIIHSFLGKNASNFIFIILSGLNKVFTINKQLKFPFGNNYGWGYKISIKTKHLIYIFFENRSITIMIKVNEPKKQNEIDLFNRLSLKGKKYWENRYPCSGGGWIHYRVLTKKDLNDIGILISLRTKKIIMFN